jgi:hypothetical protein
MRRKRQGYDPNRMADTAVRGAVGVTKVVAYSAVAVGALGLLGSMFKK